MNYKKLMQNYKEEMLESLNEFLKINSEYDKKTITKKAPFGKGVESALNYFAKLGELNGFAVDTCDGYCSELTIGGGKNTIGIFGHADVVPATGDWEQDPYTPVIKNGNIYGRGTSDDKGPLIAALYAVIALKDAGLIKNYKVQIVCGGDEERGSGCLTHYYDVLKKEYPTYGFTPDSDFPLIYGEKGITNFYSTFDVKIPHVKSIKGGVVPNAVCDKVSIEFDDDKEFVKHLKENNIEFENKDNIVTLFGKSCHGSMPQLGINAALNALRYLGEVYHVDLLTKIGVDLMSTSGEKFNCFAESKELGETTYCVGMVDYKNNKLTLTVNFRFPETINYKDFVVKFDEHFGSKSECEYASECLLFDTKSTLVKTLYKAYKKETHDRKNKPLTIGGGTYAKHAKNTVAFGGLFPGRESTMHEANEYMPLDDFFKMAEIYARAINDLGKQK